MDRSRTFPILAALGVVIWALFGSGCAPKVSDKDVRPISVTELARQVERGSDNLLVIDARDPARFEAGHIPGARLVDLADVEVFEPTPGIVGYRTIVVYGENPASGRSMAMAKRLMTAKNGEIRLLEGGFAAWTAGGQPVSRRP